MTKVNYHNLTSNSWRSDAITFKKIKLMNFQLEDKQDAEINRLNYYFNICNDALNDYSANHPYQLAEYEKAKIITILKRLFEGEIDYLERSPEDYFELYEDE